ncbi:MAG: universal stress protein [Lentisphaeria bacterium]|jgi:nucleotide-binding universal stress UspA family protein|nr:universal stress protein [Lentisphaeria bacterium]MDY0176256.1 universal stress protein [Lentisphaeria bacterium]NLZ60330.1 universal stress protein [Lentisphaerota bacterium]
MPEKPEMTKCILCCTDFSENAARAFDFALDAALRRKACRLYLLHVIPEPESQFWRTYIYGADINVDEKAKRDLDAKVNSEYHAKVPEHLDFKVEFRIGKEQQKILEFAKEVQADLIVLGRQGKGTLSKIFFGSVAQVIVRRAKCPVLVVPPQK